MKLKGKHPCDDLIVSCQLSIKQNELRTNSVSQCCRDRAQERRKGFNPDYERVAADLSGLVGESATGELNSISVEDSKYLGGDVDHTHLVKGLDYALLQKVNVTFLLVTFAV